MSEKEHWIPTPEELEEEDAPTPRARRHDRDDESAGERRGPFRTLRLKLGVGRSRRYEEVEPEGITEADAAESEAGQAIENPIEAATKLARVESVRIRRTERPPKKATTYSPHSKEALFYEKAKSKGHGMGELVSVARGSTYTAVCNLCGAEGELVVQYEENYSDQTNWWVVRGPAIERRCQP